MRDFTRGTTGATIRAAAFLTVLFAVRGWAAADPEAACQAGRAKAAGKYANCIQGEVSKWYAQPGDGKPESCVTKYAKEYDKLRAKAQKSPETQTCDAPRFVDNGDGTVTDNLTALVWEKKTNDATVHDESKTYPWTSSGTAADGRAFTTFLAALNGAGFAGQYDWRLPTVAELLSITEPFPLCTTPPCIDATFGPTAPKLYWSSSTYQLVPFIAWVVDFNIGRAQGDPKTTPLFVYVRAVRGGF
jgi:hypothetical protein